MVRKLSVRHDAVELNMAAMLDMAFQLLTFFILTFRPAPVEDAVELRMPPPKPIQIVERQIVPPTDLGNNPLSGFNSLAVILVADEAGGLGQVFVQTNNVPVDPQLAGLDRTLREMLSDRASPFEQVLIQVGSNLHYDQLMRVMDVCARQRLGGDPSNKRPKLSLVDANDP